jgi:hypothetical protein
MDFNALTLQECKKIWSKCLYLLLLEVPNSEQQEGNVHCLQEPYLN